MAAERQARRGPRRLLTWHAAPDAAMLRKKEDAMQPIIDPTTPRYQLPLDRLPRGFVPFPDRVVAGLEVAQQKEGKRFSEDYVRHSLEQQTLAYFYQDLPVAAYRPAA